MRDRSRNRPERTRINRHIRISPIRVVMEDGTNLGVIETSEALAKAEELGLDLVEISPTARPPVCKITDYGKWKFEQSKKERESKRNSFQAEVKQVKFSPKTDDHDMEFKIKNSRGFLEEGHRVQFEVRYRGRENAHPEIGRPVLDRVAAELADIAKVEREAKYENKSMIMVMVPK